MKNLYLTIISSLLAGIIIYIILFIYTFLNLNNELRHSFDSLKNLNFHEKYSRKLNHIRDPNSFEELFKEAKVEDMLFTEINNIKNKNIIILFQGDSWFEQLTFVSEKNYVSANLIKEFGKKNKVGFVNGGIISYSPSLMNLQLDVLEDDFKILPSIVIAYIDQTDIGDEICRYKKNKIYKNNTLSSVKPETDLMGRGWFNYSEIYEISKINLSDKNKIFKTFQIINFKFVYNLKRRINNFYYKYISKTGKDKFVKCYFTEIEKYLIELKDSEKKYFLSVLNEYYNKIKEKDHIKKLILVTHPHKKHFLKDQNGNFLFKHDVSNIVEDFVKDKKNIKHINFSKIILNDKNFDYENAWFDDMVHLNSINHGNFVKKILDVLSKELY
tara:strand:+ start:1821 stop:2975 length:1155 start_codon:yes stop_codon:yes gene_type:complete